MATGVANDLRSVWHYSKMKQLVERVDSPTTSGVRSTARRKMNPLRTHAEAFVIQTSGAISVTKLESEATDFRPDHSFKQCCVQTSGDLNVQFPNVL